MVFENNPINTKLLSLASYGYLQGLLHSQDPLPENLAWKNLLLEDENAEVLIFSATKQKKRKKEILVKLVQFEENYTKVCQTSWAKAETNTKKMFLWLKRVTLSTLIVSILMALIIAIPPVMAALLPIFTALGIWIFPLFFTAALPSLFTLLANLIFARASNNNRAELEKSKHIFLQVTQALEELNEPILFENQRMVSHDNSASTSTSHSVNSKTFFPYYIDLRINGENTVSNFFCDQIPPFTIRF